MGTIILILVAVFVVLFCAGKFYEGYVEMDNKMRLNKELRQRQRDRKNQA